ncbi:MAG TPA: PKD domain-containing protein [Candidatus Saccharimonadales bacterium]|nr:PKD domain-containing protein [Candidatus Saccharimonadales bacterium]
MSSVFSEGFEGGSNGATITSSNTTYSSFSGTSVFDNSVSVVGGLSAKLSPAGGSAITLKEVFPSSPTGETHRFFRRYFRVDALPPSTGNIVLMRARQGGSATTAQVIMNHAGTITVRDGNTTVATTTSAVSLNAWFRVEWELDAATTNTQTMKLFLGSNFNGSTPTESLASKSYTQGAFDRIEDGVGNAGFTGSLWIDAVDDDNATWPGPAAGANQAPTANAGPDQGVTSGASVTLDGSGSSDSDGTIASYAWTQVSGTTVTLSDPTVVGPTFTAPIVTGAPQTLVFGLVVTDNLGAQSTQDTITVTVSAPGGVVFSEDFESGTNGTVLSTLNTAYSSFVSGPVFTNLAAVSGSLSALMVVDNSVQPSMTQNISPAVTSRYFRRYFRFSNLPSGSVTFMRVRNSGTSLITAELAIGTSGAIQILDGLSGAGVSSTKITPNTWFRVEWFLDGPGGQQTLKLFVLGNYNGSTPSETVTGTYTGSGNGTLFDRVSDGIGSTTFYTGSVWLDGVADSSTGYLGPEAGANAAPVSNAGPDQTVSTNTADSLDGTASTDSDGVINSYLWTQTSGSSTVTLSSYAAAQPTFTAPNVSATFSATFSLLVVDDKGAGSLDTMSLTISAASAFNEPFESGTNGATLTGSNTTYTAPFTGTTVFDNTKQVAGSFSAKMVITSGASVFLREVFAGQVTERYFRRYFFISAYPTGANILTILRIRDSSNARAQLNLTSGGFLQMRDGGSTIVATSTNTFPINAWVRVEWHVDGTTTHTQGVRLYTGNLLNSAVTATETLDNNYAYTGNGAATFDRVDDGCASTTYTGTIWTDEAQDQTSHWPGPASGTNQPPIVDAGSSQTVLPGDTVTLDGTVSMDPDGTISTYAWSQVTGTTVTLSSSSVAQPTFTAPYLSNGDTLVFHLIVTDNGGVTSQAGSVTITVQAANEFALKSGSWQIMKPNVE